MYILGQKYRKNTCKLKIEPYKKYKGTIYVPIHFITNLEFLLFVRKDINLLTKKHIEF